MTHERPSIQWELMGHLEDRYDTILERERGIRQEDAPAGTVAAMGVRQALGRYLKQIHSPFLIAALDFPVPTAELAFRSAEARHFFGRGEILLNVNPYVLGKDAQELYLNRAFVSRRGNLVRLRVACYLPEAVSAEITYSANDGGWHLNSRRETAAGQGCFFFALDEVWQNRYGPEEVRLRCYDAAGNLIYETPTPAVWSGEYGITQ